jgi:hypothetical protein
MFLDELGGETVEFKTVTASHKDTLLQCLPSWDVTIAIAALAFPLQPHQFTSSSSSVSRLWRVGLLTVDSASSLVSRHISVWLTPERSPPF